MRVLFVMPVDEGSGETVTSVHVASLLLDAGWTVAFLGTAFALRFVPASMDVPRWSLGSDGPRNLKAWQSTLRAFRPDVVVFADYPLMLFNHGTAPLARVPGWADALDQVNACLVTFDHFGFAQQTAPLFLGPPHLSMSAQHFEPLPRRMRVLLPCPMHEPDVRAGVTGEPFRSCPLPLGMSAERRRQVRSQWLGSDGDRLLVFHSVPNWAWRHAERLGLALYDVLPRLLDGFFAAMADRLTFVSLNNGRLLQAPAGARLSITNLGPMPVAAFEELLFAADLVLTENGLSISIGKAVCAQQVAAVLRNRFTLTELMKRADSGVRDVLSSLEARRLGAVFPFEAFPTVTPGDVDAIGLYRGNTLTDGFAALEIFGGRNTADALQQLLTDQPTRDVLRERQQVYIDKLTRLDDISAILAGIVVRT